MKQILLLNGPPRCGKDTLAKHLCKQKDYHHLKFANELKRTTHRLYNTPLQEADAYEKLKDTRLTEFFNLTPREAYINVSEHYIKRFHGEDFFGLLLILKIKSYNPEQDNVFVVSDCGFQAEIVPLLHNFNPKLISVIRIHRPGFTFSGDSRSYLNRAFLEDKGCKVLDLNNTSTQQDFLQSAESLLKKEVPCLYQTELTYNPLLC